jgi:hypothetical protein
MRRFGLLLRGLTGAALGLALVLPAAAAPARADDGDQYDYSQFVDILIDAFEKGTDGGYSPAEIADMVSKIVNAVNGVKADVLAGLDSKVSAAIYSQMQAAITKVPNLNVPWLRGPAIDSIHNAAYLAKSQVNQSYSDAARDAIGRAMMTLFTTLNTAYIQVDAEQAAQGRPSNIAATHRPYYRQGLADLVREMDPACYEGGVPKAGLITYSCSFNGETVRAEFWAGSGTYTIDGGPPIAGAIDEGRIQELVMRDTVRPLAQRALDELTREGVPLP